jgi:RNA polymerase sigma factor (sigma-70 family)
VIVDAGAPPVVDEQVSFVEWTAPYLSRMALVAARLGPPDERDDIVQDALTRAWRSRRTFDERKGSLSGWLCAITANVARSSHRHRWKLRAHLPAPRDRDTDAAIDLDAAIKLLPPRQRLAVECFYAVALSVEETAALMGCSEGTVKSTLSDARARLRAQLAVAEGSDDE